MPAPASPAELASGLKQNSSLSGFWSLIAVQFQGAFSDNALKWLVSFLVLDSGLSKERRDLWFVLVVPLLFAIPFLLFSIPGGFLADKYSKRSVAIWTKLFELGVMGLVTLALAYDRLDVAAASLFLACTQGAIFGPTKYGLLPELLPDEQLSWGNGIIELTTLLAAIIAALAGGFLAVHFRGRQIFSGLIFLGLTIFGLIASLGVTRVPAADPKRRFEWNIVREFFSDLLRMSRDRVLWTALWANTFFWFLGSLLLLNIVLYANDILHVNDQYSSYLLAALSLGIGVGSFVAGFASGHKIEQGMILPGMGGIVLTVALLSWSGPKFSTAAILLALLGFAGGFYVVPVNALIQRRPDSAEKGRAIAVANLLSFVGVALQPLAQYAMIQFGHPDPGRVFLVAGGATLLMAVILISMLPGLGSAALRWTRLGRGANL
jgi:acyl-[acyl-carrier-protein]-phospholipid O-acyltransferase/long-chain-fatty-acid--[acyl-carrier-protein] ligase